MVLNVHGGPWARDDWGYDPEHQLLANRGYAVLAVNYRGSTGFGKQFINAADKEWAGKMHDDLIDAVNWAVEEKIADQGQGRDHGRQLRRLRHAGRTDLHARRIRVRSGYRGSFELDHAHGEPAALLDAVHAGDEAPRGRLGERGGAEVPRIAVAAVLRRQDQEAAADRPGGERSPREAGRGRSDRGGDGARRRFPSPICCSRTKGTASRPENRFAYYAVTEAFLATNLGGRNEPIGQAFEGAVFTVPAGEQDVPELHKALERER